MARSAALFLASLAAGLATLRSEAAGDELLHLRAADAILSAGDLDSPVGIGFPLLIANANALGGADLVAGLLAAIAAIGFVLAAALARRLVPEPWATGGVAAVALSAPAVAHGASVRPELTAGALLAGAALLALRVRDRPATSEALLAGLLIALLPWLGARFLVPGLAILAAMAWWLARRGRSLPAIFAAEVVASSLIAYVSVNEALYDAPVPPADEELRAVRAERLLSMWLGPDHGLLRWAPVVALAFLGAWLLWRSRRERLARALPGVRDREAAAELLLLVCAAQAATALFLAPSPEGFAGRHLVAALPCAAALAAWGLRHHPRAGAALAALSLLVTAWWLADPGSDAPWQPFVDAAALAAIAVMLAGEVRGRLSLK